jgi:hypothetical protein
MSFFVSATFILTGAVVGAASHSRYAQWRKIQDWKEACKSEAKNHDESLFGGCEFEEEPVLWTDDQIVVRIKNDSDCSAPPPTTDHHPQQTT